MREVLKKRTIAENLRTAMKAHRAVYYTDPKVRQPLPVLPERAEDTGRDILEPDQTDKGADFDAYEYERRHPVEINE